MPDAKGTIPALTICQPYAELIARGDKLVENRTWRPAFSGTLAIHAGKSREWLSSYAPLPEVMDFGMVVALARLVGSCRPGDVARKYPHLAGHDHIEGPWCWILENVRRLPQPIPCSGAQGIWKWTPPDDFDWKLITAKGVPNG